MIYGGGHENGLRSGTENVPAIVGFGLACELAAARQTETAQHTARLREQLEAGLTGMGAVIFGGQASRIPNTCYFALPDIEGDTLVVKLDKAGFAVAAGAACSSVNPGQSHVLSAMGIDRCWRAARCVSLGRDNTVEQIDGFLRATHQNCCGVAANGRYFALITHAFCKLRYNARPIKLLRAINPLLTNPTVQPIKAIILSASQGGDCCRPKIRRNACCRSPISRYWRGKLSALLAAGIGNITVITGFQVGLIEELLQAVCAISGINILSILFTKWRIISRAAGLRAVKWIAIFNPERRHRDRACLAKQSLEFTCGADYTQR